MNFSPPPLSPCLPVLSQGVHLHHPPDPDNSKNEMKTREAVGEFIGNFPRDQPREQIGLVFGARGGVMVSPLFGSHGTEQS